MRVEVFYVTKMESCAKANMWTLLIDKQAPEKYLTNNQTNLA